MRELKQGQSLNTGHYTLEDGWDTVAIKGYSLGDPSVITAARQLGAVYRENYLGPLTKFLNLSHMTIAGTPYTKLLLLVFSKVCRERQGTK